MVAKVSNRKKPELGTKHEAAGMAAGGNVGTSYPGIALGTWQAFRNSTQTSPPSSPTLGKLMKEKWVVMLEDGTGSGDS